LRNLRKIYVMTDLEGVAGVLDHDNWCTPQSRYYEKAKGLLTREVNAAVDGFLRAGGEEIVVADGHGWGGLDPELLDERARLLRGWPEGPYPLGLDETFDACAWVGQHAKSGSLEAHLAHTQSFGFLDLSVNGLSIGEFGQFALCASELGVRSIFGSGDLAFCREAEALVPGIVTVSVKRGLGKRAGQGLTREEYSKLNTAAIHLSPGKARESIARGALDSLSISRDRGSGIAELKPPLERVAVFRPTEDKPKMISRERHDTSFIGLMNTAYNPEPVEG